MLEQSNDTIYARVAHNETIVDSDGTRYDSIMPAAYTWHPTL